MTSFCYVRRAILPCLCVALIASAVPLSAQSAKQRSTPSPSPNVAFSALPDIVATVNGDPIKKKDLERLVQAVAGDSGHLVQDLKPAEQSAAYASVLDTMISDKLVSKEAIGESVDDLSVEARYGELMKQYPNPQAFTDQVKKAGETTEHVKQNIRGQLAQQQWLEKQIAGDITVTPQEVEKFYKESPPNKFDEPEMIHARHILTKVRKDATPEEAVAAEDKAKALLDRIKKGEKFEDVARQQSDDSAARDVAAKDGAPARAGNGGDLDWFARDRIMPEFGDVAFKLKPGEIAGPVRTRFGYHLIQLVDRKSAHTATFDEARDQIATFLQSEKRKAALARVMANLRAQAKIQTFLP